jgi:Ca2+-binding EF-hand superfamily protein
MVWTFSGIFVVTDRDGDEILTEDEFSSLQTEGDGEKDGETLTQGENERRKEFRDVIDKNHDGKADRKELLVRVLRNVTENVPTVNILLYINGDYVLV